LLRLGIARAEPLGEKTAWRAAVPVTQWTWTKP
jgi:precorrin-6Y C5,15-methyltransferase (decarboxylating)